MTGTVKRPPRISDQLREVIAARGLSGYAVATAAGLNPAIISRWIGGERGLSSESLDAVAEALGVRLVEGRGGLRRIPGRKRNGTAG
jgi:transcriptional regulator with XRE-family HTH domain